VLLHISENIDERKKPAEDKQCDATSEQAAHLQNDCPPYFHHSAILTAAAPLRNSAALASAFENFALVATIPSYGGQIAKTRAGKPDPPFGFGNVTIASAPLSGT